MAVTADRMVNEDFEPGGLEEEILELLKEGRQSGEPWGRANPKWISDETGERRQYVNRALKSLVDAGWIRRRATGLYELVEDPRE